MDTSIREYMLSDPSICDALVEPFKKSVAAIEELLSYGGGTEIHYQRMVTSAVKAKTVVFPAALTHLHRGVVCPTHHKYLLNGWLWWA